MKKLLVFLMLNTLYPVVYGQKAPVKFGDASLDEVKMTQYEPDPTASAPILADYGVSVIEYQQSEEKFKLIHDRTTRIKILTKDGYS